MNTGLNRLGQKGIAHLFALTAIIVGVAAVGTYFLVASHADPMSKTSTISVPLQRESGSNQGGAVARTSSVRPFYCGSKAKPVNVKVSDFTDQDPYGKLLINARESLHSTGYAIVCMYPTGGRKLAYTPNKNTITGYKTCPSGRQFAFDLRNPDGDGYDESPWVVKTKSFRKKTPLTLYCIQNSKMGDEDKTGALGLGHTYKWQPIVDLSKGCNSKERRYANCKKGWFFSYSLGGDVYKESGTRRAN